MSLYSVFQKRFGLVKESVRGTAETTPTVWFQPLMDSEMLPKLNFTQNDELRGLSMGMLPPIPTYLEGLGTMKMYLRPSEIGEFLHMFIGDAGSAQQGGSAAYLHTFTPGVIIQPDSYTIFVDRNLSVKKYNFCQVKQIKISRSPDKPILFEAGIMFDQEAAGSIGSPSYAQSGALTFQHDTFQIAGSSNTKVKNWDVVLDNGLVPLRTTGQQQGVSDFLATQHTAQISFEVYFESETEFAKFIAGTSTSIQITVTDTVAIASTYKYSLDLLFDDVTYTVYPRENSDKILSAKVTAQANYSIANSRQYRLQLQNASTAYA